MRRPLNRIVSRGLSELDCMAEFAQIIARLEGWSGPPLNHQRRIWQALSEITDRKFDQEWTAAAIRLFAYRDRFDLCDEIAGYYQRARWEGERMRDETPQRDMKSVRPREARVERAG